MLNYFLFNSIIKEVALQLHGVVVEIKIIKRKGEPLYDVENVELPIAVTPAAVTESTANNQPLHICERTGTVITSVKTSPAMQQKIQQIEERNKENGKLPLSNRECNPNVIDHHIVMRTYCPSSSTAGTTTQRAQCKYPGNSFYFNSRTVKFNAKHIDLIRICEYIMESCEIVIKLYEENKTTDGELR